MGIVTAPPPSKGILLPSKIDPRDRLDSVGGKVNVIFFLREFVYPELLKAAGQEMSPKGVAVLVKIAIAKHTIGVPEGLMTSTYALAPEFIDALIIDENAANKAKELFASNPLF